MAASLLTARLAARGLPATVRSAGWLRAGDPVPPEVGEALARLGIAPPVGSSRVVEPAELAAADLVLGMEREHVRKAVALDPDVWPKTFTLKELVRRAGTEPPRRPDEPLADWLARLHRGRTPTSMMGAARDDDVDDPFGRRAKAYVRTVEELDDLVERLIAAAWPSPA
jgi:protein-tyrosine-phosphatase